MSKKKKSPVLHDGVAKKTASKMTFIEFGDPEPVAAWGCYYGSLWDGYNGWYTPPIERMDLAMLANIAPYHGAVLRARVNMIMQGFRGGRWYDTRRHGGSGDQSADIRGYGSA